MKYFSNSSWLLLEKFISMGVSLFVGVWIARYLGPEQLGLLSYAQSVIAIFAVVASLGLDGIVLREIVKDETKNDIYLGTAFYLKLYGTFIIIALLLFALNFLPEDSQKLTLVFILSIGMIFESSTVIKTYFQSHVLSKYVVYSNILTLLVGSIIKIGFILNDAPLVYFAYAILVEKAVLFSGLFYFYIKSNKSIKNWSFDKEQAKYLLKNSWPLILSTMSYIIYTRTDQIMIQEMLGSYEVGIYSVAVRIYELPFVLAMVIASTVSPMLIKAYQRNKQEFNDKTLILLSYITLLSYIIVLIIFIFSKDIILLLFGKQYAESGIILSLLVVSLIPMFNSFLRSGYMIISNHQKLSFYLGLFYSLLNIGLNYVLIPKFGVAGAVYATIISRVLALFGLFYFSTTREYFFIQIKSIFLMGLFKKGQLL